MADRRKLQGEIDRCHKKVQEGVEIFEDIWQKAHNAPNINQKEKYEADLKKEIKKLQRLRDQIKTWIASSEIKDKRGLVEDRKLIETQMERFKVLERETKTKAYSKEGLGAAQKLDPVQREKEDLNNWITNTIESLNIQIDQFESEIESVSVHLRKKKNDKDKQERVEKLKMSVDKHKYHINQLETIMRMLDNSTVDVNQVKGIKDDVEYYVESSQEPDFEENEYIYDDLELEDIGEFLNKSKMNTTVSTTGSANNSGSVKDTSAANASVTSNSSTNAASISTSLPTCSTTTTTTTTTTSTTSMVSQAGSGSQTSLQELNNLNTSNNSTNPGSLNNGICNKQDDESHSTSVQSTGPKGTPSGSPVPSSPGSYGDGSTVTSGPNLINGPSDCNHISDRISNGSHLVNNLSSLASAAAAASAVGNNQITNYANQSSSVSSSSSNSSNNNINVNNSSITSAAVSSAVCSTSLTSSSSSGKQPVWTAGATTNSVATAAVCSNNNNSQQHSPPLDPTTGLLYASAAAAVKHSDQIASGNAFAAQSSSSSVNSQQQQQQQQQLQLQLQQQQQLQQQIQQLQQQELNRLQATGSNGDQFNAGSLYGQTTTANGGWTRNNSQTLNGPINRLADEQSPMSSLKSIAQQAVLSAGLSVGLGTNHQLDQQSSSASVSPSLHQPNVSQSTSSSGNQSSQSSSGQQMTNIIGIPGSVPCTKPSSVLLGGAGAAAAGPQQPNEAHIPPLLGIAPLGPVQLNKPTCYQLHMLEAASRHVIHPLDSQRARNYLTNGSVQTPSFYPQQALPHSDTLDFFHRLSTETLFFIFYFMEGTKAQFLAAKALKKQSWRFHTKFMMWFQRHEEPKTITDEYEQGTYIYFDYEKWGQRKREHFTFEYRFLEDRDLN